MDGNDAFCYPYHIDDCMTLEKWPKGPQDSEMLPRVSTLMCHVLFWIKSLALLFLLKLR